MIPEHLKKALRDYRDGQIGESEIEDILHNLPFQDLGFAKVDHHRLLVKSSGKMGPLDGNSP